MTVLTSERTTNNSYPFLLQCYSLETAAALNQEVYKVLKEVRFS